MLRYKIILNPVAGHGNGLKALSKIRGLLDKLGLNYHLVCTERPGHARQLAQQAAADGYDVVTAAGGDGTINEVINGLMQVRPAGGRRPALGVLSVGRGNDFISGVDIPLDLAAACQVLAHNRRRAIDIGRVTGGTVPEGRYFGNCVGVGFDAIGTIEAAKLPRWGGFLSFLAAVLKTIFVYNQAPLATIDYNGQQTTQRSLMISVMNGKRIGGGGFIMAPAARPNDGLLDLCIAEQMSSLAIFGMLPKFMQGTQAASPKIKTGQTQKVTITAQDMPLPAQADGEIISTHGMRLEIELLPQQIEVLCP